MTMNWPETKQKSVYETVAQQQNTSLYSLVVELTTALNVTVTEIWCLPDVAGKNPTEADTAKW